MSKQHLIERGRRSHVSLMHAALPAGRQVGHLPGWSQKFIDLVRTAIRIPAALYSVYLYVRGYRGYIHDSKVDPAKVERDSIRRVLAQIKAQREQFSRESGREVAATRPSLQNVRPEKGVGKRPQSRLAKPIIYGLGGRRSVTEARLTEMGITPMLLREVPVREDRSAIEMRQRFAADVKHEILDDLRSLLEESR